jgi:ELWxxDGT repeat protein
MRTLLTYLPFLAFGAAEAQSTRIAEFRTDMAGGPSQGVAMGGKLYFSAYDLDHGRELWVTDGTAEGTYRLKDINPGLGSGIAEYFEWSSFPVGDLLYFRATDGQHRQ